MINRPELIFVSNFLPVASGFDVSLLTHTKSQFIMKKVQKSKSKRSSIFIRATEEKELSLIADIKRSTGVKAASQAFLHAAAIYLRQVKQIDKLNQDIEKVTKQLREAETIIARIDNSQVLVASYSKKFLHGKHIQLDLV